MFTYQFTPSFKPSLIVIAVSTAMASQIALANTEQLEQVEVSAESSNRKVNVEKKNAKRIQQELIRDTKDLVRYSTDVGVADNGRRLKGFAIHGVDANRVNISVDGINLPDSEENSLYARYGNFNNSRLSIDSELATSIDVVKGSDSLRSGSGALGGSVNYRTLNASDLIQGERGFGGLLRAGYASKNNEKVYTAGVGYVSDIIDAILVYSYRNGNEFDSRGKNTTPYAASRYENEKEIARSALVGGGRTSPDPSKHQFHSYLAKFSWKMNPTHRVGISITGQNNSQYTYEHSYHLLTSWRESDDLQKRLNVNAFYEWTPEKNPILGKARADLDYQKTENGAVNYKGTYDRVGGDWRTGYDYAKGALFNDDYRNMITTYQRASLLFEGQPFHLGGDHLLTLRSYVAQREFENVNHDKILNTDGSINSERRYTIQRPVISKQFGFSLQDSIYWNDIFSSVAGIRYDHEKVTPQSYDVNLSCTSACLRAEQINPLSTNTFINWNGSLGLEAQINPTWKTGYAIGTGYRVPTASEMYFSYDNPAGNWKSNPSLKAERSINHNLYLQADNDVGNLDINLFYTRYHNFLFEQETIGNYFNELCPDYQDGVYCNQNSPAIYQQMVNLDKAKIYGLEAKGSINLNQISPLPDGFKASAAVGYSRGKLSNGDSLLSIQPLKLVLGFDYEAPSGKWGIFSRTTYQRGKKASDANITERDSSCSSSDWYTGLCNSWTETTTHLNYRWLNKSYWIFDLFGYVNLTKNITLRAGVYNLFDTKYHTWDSLRGINYRSTINTVDTRRTSQSLARFYAPGRNFSTNLEIRF